MYHDHPGSLSRAIPRIQVRNREAQLSDEDLYFECGAMEAGGIDGSYYPPWN